MNQGVNKQYVYWNDPDLSHTLDWEALILPTNVKLRIGCLEVPRPSARRGSCSLGCWAGVIVDEVAEGLDDHCPSEKSSGVRAVSKGPRRILVACAGAEL